MNAYPKVRGAFVLSPLFTCRHGLDLYRSLFVCPHGCLDPFEPAPQPTNHLANADRSQRAGFGGGDRFHAPEKY